ncbi:MAG TPA: hypothetical protein VMH39_04285 [Gemmatimonadaceae bacterium]|nr:hypothetical protein [Gemmatimonadaceae bacterium]
MTGPMRCDEFERLVDELLDPGGSEPVRAAAAAHADACAACAGLLADLRRLRADAARLGTLEPARDLWSGIAARLDTPVIAIADRGVEPAERPAAAASRRRGWWMAAAAAGLVAATAGVTTLVVRGTSTAATAGGVGGVLASGPSAGAPVLRASNARGVDAAYDSEIVALHALVARRRASLDPATVAVIERNLAVIDTAIAECKNALARDPESVFLKESLTSAYDSKVALLRTAVALPSAE